MPSRQLAAGACVEITGLVSRPELNGCVGAVVRVLGAERVEVRLTPLAPQKATLRDDSPDTNGFVTNARGVLFAGVSASKAFQVCLRERFVLQEQYDVPRLFFSCDDVSVWRRKQ